MHIRLFEIENELYLCRSVNFYSCYWYFEHFGAVNFRIFNEVSTVFAYDLRIRIDNRLLIVMRIYLYLQSAWIEANNYSRSIL